MISLPAPGEQTTGSNRWNNTIARSFGRYKRIDANTTKKRAKNEMHSEQRRTIDRLNSIGERFCEIRIVSRVESATDSAFQSTHPLIELSAAEPETRRSEAPGIELDLSIFSAYSVAICTRGTRDPRFIPSAIVSRISTTISRHALFETRSVLQRQPLHLHVHLRPQVKLFQVTL